MSNETTRQIAGFFLFFAVVIAIVFALLKIQEAVNDDYVDYSAIVTYKEYSGDVGGSPGIDMWQVRLETRRLVVVPSNMTDDLHIGDCVIVRMVSVGSVFDRGMRIVGRASDCDQKVSR